MSPIQRVQYGCVCAKSRDTKHLFEVNSFGVGHDLISLYDDELSIDRVGCHPHHHASCQSRTT